MKDRWINTGFEEDELKPYTEPELDITDQKRIGTDTAKQAAAELTAPFFHLFTLSLMPAEPVICFVREKRAKASKPLAPFVEVRTGLCLLSVDSYRERPNAVSLIISALQIF